MSCTCDMHGRGKACHCRACCLTFSSPGSFDRHILRGGHRRPEDSGLVLLRPGVWGGPQRPRADGSRWYER
jgi:hypothetical protein